MRINNKYQWYSTTFKEKMARDSLSYHPIPAKLYFKIGEVSELCDVKPHVLRYWEQEFIQLRSIRRRGNRRYYQHHEVLLIRRIHELLYRQGFSISGQERVCQAVVILNRVGLKIYLK